MSTTSGAAPALRNLWCTPVSPRHFTKSRHRQGVAPRVNPTMFLPAVPGGCLENCLQQHQTSWAHMHCPGHTPLPTSIATHEETVALHNKPWDSRTWYQGLALHKLPTACKTCLYATDPLICAEPDLGPPYRRWHSAASPPHLHKGCCSYHEGAEQQVPQVGMKSLCQSTCGSSPHMHTNNTYA